MGCDHVLTRSGPIQPVDASVVPRYSGLATFARLPILESVGSADVAVVGVPFDAGTSYRPGARFGPSAVRQASRLLRPHNPALDCDPFAAQQVVDAGDIACSPFNIAQAVQEIEQAAHVLLDQSERMVVIGGDHTIALPLLRAVVARWGPVALVHFDAHLDTWDTYMGAELTHGTPFRRAREEGLLLDDHSMHVGLRGPLYSRQDLADDHALGFKAISTSDLDELGVAAVIEQIRTRVGTAPLYLSIDIDVLDPAHAPGTGTPEPAGLSTRELVRLVRGFAGLSLVGADVVEVSPAYDHAELTSLAAAQLVYEIISLNALTPPPPRLPGCAAATEVGPADG